MHSYCMSSPRSHDWVILIRHRYSIAARFELSAQCPLQYATGIALYMRTYTGECNAPAGLPCRNIRHMSYKVPGIAEVYSPKCPNVRTNILDLSLVVSGTWDHATMSAITIKALPLEDWTLILMSNSI